MSIPPTAPQESDIKITQSVIDLMRCSADSRHREKAEALNRILRAVAEAPPSDITAEQLLKDELAVVDAVLSRRDALDGFPDRIAKINAAIHIAQTVDPKGELAKALAELAAIRSQAAVAEAPAAQPWQPIETAPKDGEEFLACRTTVKLDKHDYLMFRCIAYESRGHFFRNDGGALGFKPTHWQPLPSPPTEAPK